MPKILIIEDDSMLSVMYQTIFKKMEYEVELAGDGQAGLVKAKNTHPAVILLDIMMPKLNGLEFLKQIKRDPELKAIPVLVLTNLADDRNALAALELGAVRYIIKSDNLPREITEIVGGILAGPKGHD